MAGTLPDLDFDRFVAVLKACAPGVSRAALESLWVHYGELRRWNLRLSLIGPGTAHVALFRHYAESLAALPLLGSAVRVADLGSGAGFPGLVLAAARPNLEMSLVEARQRKAVFLRSAAQKASVRCHVVNARLGASLPEGFPESLDLVTIRALRLDEGEWAVATSTLAEGGRILRWVGPKAVGLPSGFMVSRSMELPGGDRMIEELVRTQRKDRNG